MMIGMKKMWEETESLEDGTMRRHTCGDARLCCVMLCKAAEVGMWDVGCGMWNVYDVCVEVMRWGRRVMLEGYIVHLRERERRV